MIRPQNGADTNCVNNGSAKHYLPWDLYTLLYVFVNENSIHHQAKKEKLRILKLRIITWELFRLLEVEGPSNTFSRQRIVHKNDILIFYIKFTKDTLVQVIMVKVSSRSP